MHYVLCINIDFVFPKKQLRVESNEYWLHLGYDNAGFEILNPSEGHMHCYIVITHRKPIDHFTDFATLKEMQV